MSAEEIRERRVSEYVGSHAASISYTYYQSSRRVCVYLCVCVSANLMLNISETKRFLSSMEPK